jgi:hypothetical protein
MLRKILKAVVPSRFLVAARLAATPEISRVPLVAIPAVAGVMDRIVNTYGYGRAFIDNAPVDANGSPLPWYTYPMIEYLESFDLSSLRVFEYGCGNSTLWWMNHVREVVSVEDNPEWHHRIKKQLASNTHLLLEQDHDEYCKAIEDFGMFDLIVVDGSARHDCCQTAVKHLNPGGGIILDNSDCLPQSTEFLRSAGLFEIAMNGFVMLLSRTSRTSLFISQPCLLRPRPHRPSVAGTVEDWDKDQSRAKQKPSSS